MGENVMGSLVHDALKLSSNSQISDGEFYANIKIVGCGGGGCNATNWLYKKGIHGAEVIAVNTDKQHLDSVEADKKILIGKKTTKGLGCGGFPDKGREAAKEQLNELKSALEKSDMVFITAGMGGGTGTGAAPMVAQIAKERGAIVIGAVTMPFSIERTRIDNAEFGLEQLREMCDTVIVIDNNKLVELAGNLPIGQAFAVANELISTMIKGVVEIISIPSLVNLDFADVKAIMKEGNVSVVGIGESDTQNRVKEAVHRALTNPLLDVDYEGANGALIHVSGGPDLTLEEVNEVGQLVTKTLAEDANVIWGSRISNELSGKLRVMTIITGVTSPHILGKNDGKAEKSRKKQLEKELGIDVL